MKELQVNGVTFRLEDDRKLYAFGDGYLVKSLDNSKTYLTKDSQEIDSCIKDIDLSSPKNSIFCRDTRDQTYDIIIHKNTPKRILQIASVITILSVVGYIFYKR
jgi:hypothetical protein